MTKILLVEDDERIVRPLKRELEREHYLVDVAGDGEEGWHYLSLSEYDLLILDVMLPRLDGIGLCRRLRQHTNGVPVLMLTARDTTSDKVLGLDAGADDYLIKPFEIEELHARLRSLLRRQDPHRQTLLQHGPICLDPACQVVTVADRTVDLTPREYQLLEHFLRHPTQIFNRERLTERLWGWEESPESNVIKAHIKGLRRKLKDAGAPDPIETVFGFGYRLNSHV